MTDTAFSGQHYPKAGNGIQPMPMDGMLYGDQAYWSADHRQATEARGIRYRGLAKNTAKIA
jgi:hypothetical protein